MVKILLALICLFPLASQSEVFYNQAEQGWYWYDENLVESPDNDLQNAPISIEIAKAQLEALKKELEDKKALALMSPTEQNIKDYIQVQNSVNKRAETFATTWQKVIIKNPELDHTIKSPTNAIARRVYHEEQREDKQKTVTSFTNKYGLFFFFKSNCAYCHKFAPILKMFEENFGVTVVPVSLDGKGLPEYPNPKPDNGIAEKLNITIVPSVIAVDPKTGKSVPITFGLISMEELSYRINLLAQDETGAEQ